MDDASFSILIKGLVAARALDKAREVLADMRTGGCTMWFSTWWISVGWQPENAAPHFGWRPEAATFIAYLFGRPKRIKITFGVGTLTP